MIARNSSCKISLDATTERCSQRVDVLRRGTAATPDDLDSQLGPVSGKFCIDVRLFGGRVLPADGGIRLADVAVGDHVNGSVAVVMVNSGLYRAD